MLRSLLIFALLGFCVSAHADWAAVGAAYRCDPRHKSFEIVATMETSDSAHDVERPKWFTDVHELQSVTCTFRSPIGAFPILATIGVEGPSEGRCAGGGKAFINMLKAGSKLLIDVYERLGSACLTEKVITSLKISVERRKVVLEVCRGDWSWDDGFGSSVCDKSTIDGQR